MLCTTDMFIAFQTPTQSLVFHWSVRYICPGSLLLVPNKSRYSWKIVESDEKHQYYNPTQIRVHLRERPFNLKAGGYGFFLKKYSDSQCCWKKYSDFSGGKKKKSDSEFLSYNLMLNSWKKNCTSRDKKNKYSNSCVVWKFFFEQNKKP